MMNREVLWYQHTFLSLGYRFKGRLEGVMALMNRRRSQPHSCLIYSYKIDWTC